MRKVIPVVIDKPGRDFGKTFEIHEMSAFQAERWAMRAILAVGAGNVEVPSPPPDSGLAGILELGLRSIFNLPWEKAEPLLEEMMACVRYVPDPAKPETARPVDRDHDDIEEAQTITQLRSEVFELHTGFSPADALSNLVAGVIRQYSSLATQITPEPSEPSSAPETD